MTVNAETPLVSFLGPGTDFPFSWSFEDNTEIEVRLNGTIQGLDIDYELVNVDFDTGGTVRFFTATVAADEIDVLRRTPITQQVDYQDFQAFPSETHEMQLDKDTRILQELIDGGRAVGGPVNLAAVPGPNYVDVTNSAGTDARLPSWDCEEDGDFAGVFHGEFVEAGGAPADGAVTNKPDGYVWFELTAL